MPALGYIPQPQFAFPRSFLEGIEIRHDLTSPSWSGSLCSFWIAGPPDALCKVKFKDEFIPWSSNRYTLDWIVEWATYEYPPNPATADLPYYLVYRIPDNRFRGSVLLDVTYGSLYTVHQLAAAPGSYWQPPQYP